MVESSPSAPSRSCADLRSTHLSARAPLQGFMTDSLLRAELLPSFEGEKKGDTPSPQTCFFIRSRLPTLGLRLRGVCVVVQCSALEHFLARVRQPGHCGAKRPVDFYPQGFSSRQQSWCFFQKYQAGLCRLEQHVSTYFDRMHTVLYFWDRS